MVPKLHLLFLLFGKIYKETSAPKKHNMQCPICTFMLQIRCKFNAHFGYELFQSKDVSFFLMLWTPLGLVHLLSDHMKLILLAANSSVIFLDNVKHT